jgi:DNA-binding response OmpR family regulator
MNERILVVDETPAILDGVTDALAAEGFDVHGESDGSAALESAESEPFDRVLGLEIGADDYIAKPFSEVELLGRVRAILRRRELDRQGDSTLRRLGGLSVDIAKHEVLADGESVVLTPSEHTLLALLAQEPGRVFTRREIMQHLWQSTYVGDERACDAHVSNLRRKIERDPSRPERIVTVPGFGYKLVAI